MLSHPRVVESVRSTCLRTNTSVLRAGAFGSAAVTVTSCSVRDLDRRVGFRTTELTERITSR